MDLETAELCLHHRGRLAFAAAAVAGLPGEYRALESAALLSLITTSPALSFLNSVTGVAAGYAAPKAVSDVLLAEHSTAGVRRFLARRGNEAVAAAAMSLHRDVAVLGGSATVPAARGHGAQTALLQHRLRMAEAAGCVAATATAAPDSPSTRNLAQAGFTLWLRHGWRRSAAVRQP